MEGRVEGLVETLHGVTDKPVGVVGSGVFVREQGETIGCGRQSVSPPMMLRS